jgi:hypothetical protein
MATGFDASYYFTELAVHVITADHAGIESMMKLSDRRAFFEHINHELTLTQDGRF